MRDCLRLHERPLARRAALCRIAGELADRGDDGAAGDRIDRHAVHAGTTIERRRGDGAVVAPCEAVCRTRHGDPELSRVLAEAHAGDLSVEHALHTCRGDALFDGDDARIGERALRCNRATGGGLLSRCLEGEEKSDDHSNLRCV